MTWFAASALVAMRTKEPSKGGPIEVYENVILVEADNPELAEQIARIEALKAEVEDDTFTIDGKPGYFSFVGIRKILRISNPTDMKYADQDPPVTGAEISYSLFEVKSEDELAKLARGESVTLTYLE